MRFDECRCRPSSLAACTCGKAILVLLLLARDERASSGAVGCGPADLDLGGVQPQLDALGLGIGEHIRQGPQPQARTVGDRASTFGQEPAYLSDRTGDSGTVDEEHKRGAELTRAAPLHARMTPPRTR